MKYYKYILSIFITGLIAYFTYTFYAKKMYKDNLLKTLQNTHKILSNHKLESTAESDNYAIALNKEFSIFFKEDKKPPFKLNKVPFKNALLRIESEFKNIDFQKLDSLLSNTHKHYLTTNQTKKLYNLTKSLAILLDNYNSLKNTINYRLTLVTTMESYKTVNYLSNYYPDTFMKYQTAQQDAKLDAEFAIKSLE